MSEPMPTIDAALLAKYGIIRDCRGRFVTLGEWMPGVFGRSQFDTGVPDGLIVPIDPPPRRPSWWARLWGAR